MSNYTGTNVEVLYGNAGQVGTAKASFTSEVQINDTAGMGVQAFIPARFWSPYYSEDRTLKVEARGILSATGTPTYTFTTRLGAAGSTSTAIVLGSAALTTTSSPTNQIWEFEGYITMKSLGADGTNSTIQGIGSVESPGLANVGALWGGAASPGTVATVDASITNFINFNVACSASNAANSIQILQLFVYGLN